MKLYLSSHKLGTETDILTNLKSNHKKVLIVPNASDVYPDNEIKRKGINECIDELIQLGFEYEILDLKQWFNKEIELKKYLQNYNAYYVLGGNTFILRQAMRLSGFDNYLIENVNNPDILYIGYSAGICVLSPDLHGIELVDSINKDPYNLGNIIWKGIGLIDFVPVPHYNSPNNPVSEKMNEVILYLKNNNVSYRSMSDGEVIYMEV